MNEPYWIVIGRSAATIPHRHANEYLADEEAKRLAGANPNTVFTVFKAERTFVKSDIVVTELNGGIPF